MEFENLGFCVYNNIINKDSIAKHGILYGYYAIDDKRNIAPEGWHIATKEEWHELTNDTLNTFRGADWYTSTEKISTTVNNSGLTLLPSGSRDPGGRFYSINEAFITYISGEILTVDKQNILYTNSYAGNVSYFMAICMSSWFSVRCVKDY